MSGLDHFFRLRVLCPPVTLPHLVFGFLVPRGCLPSPPPYGWSTGFMTVPRTVGLMPKWRERPALPIVIKLCSAFETCPSEAKPSHETLRISPEASLRFV